MIQSFVLPEYNILSTNARNFIGKSAIGGYGVACADPIDHATNRIDQLRSSVGDLFTGVM